MKEIVFKKKKKRKMLSTLSCTIQINVTEKRQCFEMLNLKEKQQSSTYHIH